MCGLVSYSPATSVANKPFKNITPIACFIKNCFWKFQLPSYNESIGKRRGCARMTDMGMETRLPLVLVADDDWMSREVLEAHLVSAGYAVTTVHSGMKALQSALQQPPDVVLVDARMPDMSGYEVCRRLKAHNTTCLTAVIMVTALDRDEDRQQALDAGADDFIVKPFTALTLLPRVKQLIRFKQMRDMLSFGDEMLRQILIRYVDAQRAGQIVAEWQAALARSLTQ
jgi:CheY-like chemotaxis protein